MSYENWITLLGFVLTFGLGVFNWISGMKRNNSIGMLERGNYLKSVNESVSLANQRAPDAESRAFKAEKRADELEQRIEDLEGRLSYRLTFDVVLGSKPTVEHVEIDHYPNRRKKEMAFGGKDRRG